MPCSPTVTTRAADAARRYARPRPAEPATSNWRGSPWSPLEWAESYLRMIERGDHDRATHDRLAGMILYCDSMTRTMQSSPEVAKVWRDCSDWLGYMMADRMTGLKLNVYRTRGYVFTLDEYGYNVHIKPEVIR